MKRYFDLYFTTVTIQNRIPLLKDDQYKDIIIDAFRFCTENKRATIWAFVIMSNHFHIVWQILDPYTLVKVRQNLLKYTAQQFKFSLLDTGNNAMLEKFLANKKDRKFQFWKRNPLSIEILSDKVLEQKINYIHRNPEVKGMDALEYRYSSAKHFELGIKNWDFLI
ncbi:MAG: transposase [Bacteroidetes bacterium]|nr:transposase [Bacteroidota bacterium]